MPMAQVHISPIDGGRNGKSTAALKSSAKNTNKNFLQPKPQGWPLLPTGYIFVLEFVERFSYYGIRAFLVVYLTNFLQLDGFHSIVLFHVITFLAYSSSLIGGILGDVYIGRMDTIFWSCTALVATQILLATSPMFSALAFLKPYLNLTALILLFTSFGVLKPCLAAFGADQFVVPSNPAARDTYPQSISCFFATLYFVANLAGMNSLFAVPAILDLPCWEAEVCFLAGFAIPAMLISTVTILFATTKCLYRKVTPPPANMLLQSIRLLRNALANRHQSELNRKNRVPWKETDHWLEHCLDNHDCGNDPVCKYLPSNVCAKAQFCTALKAVLSIALVLTPVPLFWALLELQGTLWVAQAVGMDTRLTGMYLLPSTYMPLITVGLVLTMIPVFQLVIYPLSSFSKCCVLTYLQRMTIAGLLATLAFLLSVGVQHIIDMTIPPQPPEGFALATVFNSLAPNCNITVNESLTKYSKSFSYGNVLTGDPSEVFGYPVENSSMPTIMQISVSFSGACSGHKFVRYKMHVSAGQWNYIFVTAQGIFSHSIFLAKPTEVNGKSLVSLSMAIPCSAVGSSLITKNCPGSTSTIRQSLTPFLGQFILCQTIKASSSCLFDGSQLIWSSEETTSYPTLFAFAVQGDSMGQGSVASYTSKSVQPGSYKLFLTIDADPSENSSLIAVTEREKDVEVAGMAGVYILGVTLNGSVLSTFDTNSTDLLSYTAVNLFVIAPPNYLSVLWQLPQYLLIAAAEVMFAISGMEFCYIEAPEPLKAIVLSFWFLTIGLGGLIAFVTGTFLPMFFTGLEVQLLLSASNMWMFTLLFGYLAHAHYKYLNFKLLPVIEESTASQTSTEDVPIFRGVMDELEVLRNAALSRLPRQFVTRL